MLKINSGTVVLLAIAFLSRPPSCSAVESFDLKQADRVAFIGDALIERDIQYNYLEALLSVRFHGRGVVFRNIGWSGDTVWGESRAVFGTPADGYKALIKMIGEVQPTVAFLNYGMNESFAGPEGLAHFEAGYNTLLDDLDKTAKGARVVLLSPIAFQFDEANPIMKGAKNNENLKLYVDAIKKIADKRGARFVDLFAAFGGGSAIHKQAKLTTDGMHLNGTGYLFFAQSVLHGLVAPDKLLFQSSGSSGDYDPIAPVAPVATDGALEKLRESIAAKNLQFFNRWRPQNETYIFLFRKSEQGRNAKDIPAFDPIIATKETEIAKLADAAAKQAGL